MNVRAVCELWVKCVRLLYYAQAKTICIYGCMYVLAALVLVCVDMMVSSE